MMIDLKDLVDIIGTCDKFDPNALSAFFDWAYKYDNSQHVLVIDRIQHTPRHEGVIEFVYHLDSETQLRSDFFRQTRCLSWTYSGSATYKNDSGFSRDYAIYVRDD